MKFSFKAATLFIGLFTGLSAWGQKQPIIISPKSIDRTVSSMKEPKFVGNQISFDANNVIFKENAGFKTDKVEIENAESVIFDKKEMTFRVVNAEKIITNLKVLKNNTTDSTKAGVHYKLNDDTIYITELVEN